MKIKRIFTSAVPISILMCASLVYADSHEMKAAGEMMKEAGDTAASAVKKVTTVGTRCVRRGVDGFHYIFLALN